MKTTAGIALTRHEASCVRSLMRLAERWDDHPNRLWLFSANGRLNAMLDGGDPEQSTSGYTEGNPHPTIEGNPLDVGGGRVNKENFVCKIDIPNDGGDW